MTVLSYRSGFALTDDDGHEIVEVLPCRLWFPGGSYGGLERLFRSVALDEQTIHVERFTGGAEEAQGSIRFHGNPNALRAMLREGARGKTLTYYPDLAAPEESYPVVLMDHGTMVRLAPDAARFAYGEWETPVTLRRIDGGSLAPLVSGLLVQLGPAGPLAAATFSRASTGTRVTAAGLLESVATGKRRITWLPDANGVRRPYTLIEDARTQLVSQPEDFSAWSTAGTIGVTGGKADPFGGTAAYELDSNAGSGDAVYLTVGFTGNGEKCPAVYFREGTATTFQIVVRDSTAGASRHKVQVTWAAGVPSAVTTAGAGEIFEIEDLGGGYYRLSITADAVVATNANQLYLYPDSAGGLGTTFFFGANAWNAVFPSSYQGPTLAARAVDVLTSDFPLATLPDELTVFFHLSRPEWVDTDSDLGIWPALVSFGSNSALEIYGVQQTRTVRVRLTDPEVAAVDSSAIPAGPLVVTAQFRKLRSGGSCRINVGTGWSAWSSAASGPTNLASSTVRVMKGSGSIGTGFGALGALLIDRGLREPEYMLARAGLA